MNDETYAAFAAHCEVADLASFKGEPAITYMLEHVSPTQGDEYAELIRAVPGLPASAAAYCEKNDRLGGAARRDFGFARASPSSLRYVYHAHLVLTHLRALGAADADVVELGGGYGGLCLAVDHFAPAYGVRVRSYAIVDLPAVGELQRRYLAQYRLGAPVNFYDAGAYGADVPGRDLFLISNYCFSEIAAHHQRAYIETLFPRVAHGFITWNIVPLFDFGRACRVEPERPQTGRDNAYVFF